MLSSMLGRRGVRIIARLRAKLQRHNAAALATAPASPDSVRGCTRRRLTHARAGKRQKHRFRRICRQTPPKLPRHSPHTPFLFVFGYIPTPRPPPPSVRARVRGGVSPPSARAPPGLSFFPAFRLYLINASYSAEIAKFPRGCWIFSFFWVAEIRGGVAIWNCRFFVYNRAMQKATISIHGLPGEIRGQHMFSSYLPGGANERTKWIIAHSR